MSYPKYVEQIHYDTFMQSKVRWFDGYKPPLEFDEWGECDECGEKIGAGLEVVERRGVDVEMPCVGPYWVMDAEETIFLCEDCAPEVKP